MPIKFGFSTLGCPGWSWIKLLDHAAQWGYDSLELRFINDVRDLTQSPEVSPSQIKTSLAEARKRNIQISCVDTSVVLTKEDAENLSKGRQIIDIAHALESPYVRIFGGNLPKDKSLSDVQKELAARWLSLAEYAAPRGVKVLLESHDYFTASYKIAPLLNLVKHPSIGTIWDVHHPVRFDNEPVADYWNTLKDSIFHVHVKDSLPLPDKKSNHVLCGEGDIPIKAAIDILKKSNWSGTVCVEWEKTWHPSIQEPEIAMPQYLKKLKEYLAS